MEHKDKPQAAELTEDMLERLDRLQGSDYWTYLDGLAARVKGKVVAGSRAGTSGFLLDLADGGWVAAFLDEGRLLYRLGVGDVPSEVEAILRSDDCGDGRHPLTIDFPYAAEPCVIADEIAKCHGLPIQGLARGEDSFNFCFPDGMELDAMVVPDKNGRTALRVFWEQW